MGRFFLSFWDVCLDNFPHGCFQRRAVTPVEARAMILAARTDKKFMGVSAVDLLAPYEASKRAKQEALCGVLSDVYAIDVGVEDFMAADAESGFRTILPLDVVHLELGDTLMVVGCGYVFSPDKDVSIDERFDIAEDSVTFDVIEALPPLPPQRQLTERGE